MWLTPMRLSCPRPFPIGRTLCGASPNDIHRFSNKRSGSGRSSTSGCIGVGSTSPPRPGSELPDRRILGVLTGPQIILALKVAVAAVTAVFLVSLLALWRGNYRLHGR